MKADFHHGFPYFILSEPVADHEFNIQDLKQTIFPFVKVIGYATITIKIIVKIIITFSTLLILLFLLL